ncbi:hypothetical protein AAFF_G00369090 [Aldrovandia affinis]|uniref:Uncharacterized protein n=1 Tax=Aldrovandia affinis TaxID=143900 RepID=A0AAD7WMR0_9TELE|nr:hypothetical protein AAFF_G00369090 [Aldrovandia affinis]
MEILVDPPTQMISSTDAAAPGNTFRCSEMGEMMCEVMPTISEDTALSQRGSQSGSSDPDSHFEQLMVNMLDERDRLLDTLRETQESLGLAQQHLEDVIYDRDALRGSSAPPCRRTGSVRPDFSSSHTLATQPPYCDWMDI